MNPTSFLPPDQHLHLHLTTLGIWGGALLHGFRYFSGDPEYILVGVDSMVESCDSTIQRQYIEPSKTCMTDIPILGASVAGVETILKKNNNWDHPELFAISVPSNLEGLQVGMPPSSYMPPSSVFI